MKSKCRACLTSAQKTKYYLLSSVFPEYFSQNLSVLHLLSAVIGSKVELSNELPNEICEYCTRSLKNAYNFILLYQNAQQYLLNRLGDEKITINKTVEPNTNKNELNIALSELTYDDIIIVKEDDNNQYVFVTEVIDKPKKQASKPSSCVRPSTAQIINSCNLLLFEDVLNSKRKQKKKSFKNHETINLNRISDHNYFSTEKEMNKIKVKNDIAEQTETLIEPKHKELKITNIPSDITINIKEDDYQPDRIKYSSYDSDEFVNVVNDKAKDLLNNVEPSIQVMSVDSVLELDRRRKKHVQLMSVDNDLEIDREKQRTKEGAVELMSIESVLKNQRTAKRTRKSVGMSFEKSQMYQCKHCNKVFFRREYLMAHNNNTHNANWKEKFKCGICGHQSMTRSAHAFHKIKHEGKKHSCDQCSKVYYQLSSLKDHIARAHENKRKYLCPQCGKGFKDKSGLDYHLLVHAKQKNYVCIYCGHKSMSGQALKRHERTHTGERPYKCKYCDKTFAGCEEKLRHENGIHKGKYKYFCKYCEKGFMATYNLKIHMTQHSGPHKCDFCEKSVCTPEILEFHYKVTHKIDNLVSKEDESKNMNPR